MKTAETLSSGQATSVLGAIQSTGSHIGKTSSSRKASNWKGGSEGEANNLGILSVTQNGSLVPTA